ncbi:MAG: DUF3987 domain-containing protein, partial [Candidatus Marinimicrobia bacterium]|nr:DUF3987 domain-containing protein [Candidatus Neomarinimicrobiota bacterium]
MKRHYKNWLQAYSEWTMMSESPANFHFWTGISTIAAVLQRKAWIDEKIFQWTPNFYIIFVGPPGVVAKSTTVRLGAKLLTQVEGVKFGPNSLTWQSLTESMADAAVAVNLDPLAGIDSELYHMSCVTCSVGELGTFLDPLDRKMVDVFTDLWDGQLGSWEHKTKTQGSTLIQNPWLNVIGATTPSWLKANFPEEMVGGGLTSRILFIYGEEKRQFIPYPSLLMTDEKHAEMERKLVEDLEQMNGILGEYKLTPEALAWGAAWYEKHWTTCPDHMTNDRYEGYMARKQTHLHKIAIVMAAACRNKRVITERDMINSELMLQGAERDMIKVFESIGSSEENKNIKLILAYLQTFKGTMPLNELFAKLSIQMSNKEFDEAVNAAIKSGLVQQNNNGSIVMLKLSSKFM